MRRLIAIGLLAAALTPGTWLRTRPAPANVSQTLTLTALHPVHRDLGNMEVEGAWHLTSANSRFGSYSALLLLDHDQLMAASDTGMVLRMPVPGATGPVRIAFFAGKSETRKSLTDIESLTRDPLTGRIWVGYEGTNAIERLDRGLNHSVQVRPAAMAAWSSNSGPEAMVRLADGRFVVLSEGASGWSGDRFPALLFRSDPAQGAEALQFAFAPPAGFRPVDMAQIPDGRVLVLVRRFNLGLPPTFEVKLVLLDPAEIPASIASGQPWTGAVVAAIDTPDLQDNYEGLALAPRADGALSVWLISDDNNTTFQRTLLLKLRWQPDGAAQTQERARKNPARPLHSSD